MPWDLLLRLVNLILQFFARKAEKDEAKKTKLMQFAKQFDEMLRQKAEFSQSYADMKAQILAQEQESSEAEAKAETTNRPYGHK